MAKKQKNPKFIALLALGAFAWTFIFLAPPEFAINQHYEKYTLAERNYLASLRRQYSGNQRILTEAEARIIIKNALNFIEKNKDSNSFFNTIDAEELLFGTACTETLLCPRFQDYGGDAIGLFQVEYITFKDIWNRAIKNNHPELYTAIQKKYSRFPSGEIFFEDLQLNDELCAIFARMKYAQAKTPIPSVSDEKAQASYYKKYYNTHLGKGTEESFLTRKAKVQKSQK